MENHFKKTMIRMSFDAVLDQLKNELFKAGFEVGGITDFQAVSSPAGGSAGKYNILAVYNPLLYREMMSLSPFEGVILPCVISIVETYPGEIALVPFNATEVIVNEIHDSTLQNLAAEVTRRLAIAIHALEHQQPTTPDLVTSWS